MGVLVVLVLLFLYFLPTLIAFHRRIRSRWSVLVVNLFLGWTFLGWVISLAMSASGVRTR